jgi:hypothetical protein
VWCGNTTPGLKPRTGSRGNGNLAYEAATTRIAGSSSHGHNPIQIGGVTMTHPLASQRAIPLAAANHLANHQAGLLGKGAGR